MPWENLAHPSRSRLRAAWRDGRLCLGKSTLAGKNREGKGGVVTRWVVSPRERRKEKLWTERRPSSRTRTESCWPDREHSEVMLILELRQTINCSTSSSSRPTAASLASPLQPPQPLPRRLHHLVPSYLVLFPIAQLLPPLQPALRPRFLLRPHPSERHARQLPPRLRPAERLEATPLAEEPLHALRALVRRESWHGEGDAGGGGKREEMGGDGRDVPKGNALGPYAGGPQQDSERKWLEGRDERERSHQCWSSEEEKEGVVVSTGREHECEEDWGEDGSSSSSVMRCRWWYSLERHWATRFPGKREGGDEEDEGGREGGKTNGADPLPVVQQGSDSPRRSASRTDAPPSTVSSTKK